ncbi:MAG TPA: GGDEF domain-containing protein [Acidobacteriota bacterium]|nr:GGDEF domain-containing protein [Acidobacteriota bacterium]HRV07297.1 GGDEF domain-containing protein [Acidobacteriota bacterium]
MMWFGRVRKRNRLEYRILFRDWSDLREPEEWDEPALGSLVCILRDYSRFAIEVGQLTREMVEARGRAWVEHLLNGVPLPEEHAGGNGPSWNAVTRDFRQWRKREQALVQERFSGLEDLVWEFIEQVSRSIKDERTNGDGIRRRLNTLEKSSTGKDLEELRRLIKSVVQEVHKALAEREMRQQEELARLGEHLRLMKSELQEAKRRMALDPLTQVYSRSAFDEQLRRIAELNQFSLVRAALFIIDADNFKSVNDRFGHQAGDAALKRIADCCITNFPRNTDFIARYGGDEFVVIMDEANPETVKLMETRLQRAISATPVCWRGEEIWLSVSVGTALLEPGDTAEDWFERADKGLRDAKVRSRECKEHAGTCGEPEAAGKGPAGFLP